jgi:RNA polymerase sigma-70 factor (ECF subfamily)
MGDAGATLEELRGLYEARLPAFRRLAEVVVGDREQALDVVQDGFARAVRLRRSFDRRGPLEAWLWRIVLNSARDELARRRRRAVETGIEQAVELPGDDSGSEAAARVRAAVSELPERQRLVLFLRYFADLEYGSIGEVLGISSGTVGATLNAAHDRMRQLLEEVA